MALDGRHALSILEAIGSTNAQGEFYLTDAVGVARERGLKAVALQAPKARYKASTIARNLLPRKPNSSGASDWRSCSRRDADRARDGVLQLRHAVGPQDVVVEPNVVFGPGVTRR
jgi:bifunctional UDP-N-acetylglucosamine pyrophosphorylase/glucosamine-1-phosphate N-acetyltransferase